MTAATLRLQRPGAEEPPTEPAPFHTGPFAHSGKVPWVAPPRSCRAVQCFRLALGYHVGEGPEETASYCRLPAAPLIGQVPLRLASSPPHLPAAEKPVCIPHRPPARAPCLGSVLFSG